LRIIQVSDTHHSVEHHHFKDNTDHLASALAAETVDLIIHTGDLSMDGAGQTSDLELAKQWNSQLPAEVLSMPGNHDVGDLSSNRPTQPVNDSRLGHWRDVIGPDYWVRDIGGWRIVGLNAMLLGTGHGAEEQQSAWLATVLNADQPIAVFLHKPLCIDHVAEAPRGYWTVPPDPRARLLGLLAGQPVKLIASGHLHIQRQKTIDGINHVWAPAASFVVGASQEDLGGERRLGYVEHIFGKDSVESRFIRPDAMEERVIDSVGREIYPR
jgi:alkaline phosphatase D